MSGAFSNTVLIEAYSEWVLAELALQASPDNEKLRQWRNLTRKNWEIRAGYIRRTRKIGIRSFLEDRRTVKELNRRRFEAEQIIETATGRADFTMAVPALEAHARWIAAIAMGDLNANQYWDELHAEEQGFRPGVSHAAALSSKACPDCALINPASASRCDCGHYFE